jgi:endonuclease/exonuclease/phosphatase family metal-dependent hydrolase
MKIATYNVKNLYDAGTFIDEEEEAPVQEAFFLQRVNYFTEVFRPLDLDIICLQEVGGERGVQMIGDALGYNYFFAKPNKRGIRMAVLYKTSLTGVTCSSVSFGDLSIPSIKEKGDTANLPLISQRRDVLVLDMDTFHGKKLRVVTFHLKSNLPMYLEGEDMEHDPQANREAKFRCILYKMIELCNLRAYADTSLQEGREVVFLGDLNEDRNSSSMSILKYTNDENMMLTDVLATFTGNATTHIHRGNKLTFDTIFVSSQLQPLIKDVKVYNETLQDFSLLPLEEQVIESDHAMVTVTLE